MFHFAGIPGELNAITPTQKASGATGHHAHRADHFVRQCQRHYQRGINSHGLYDVALEGCSYSESARVSFFNPLFFSFLLLF
jgi:hypothetical protein